MLIYGDRFKGYVSEFKEALKDFSSKHLMLEIAEDYMKKHSTLNYMEDAFFKYEIDELQRKRVNLDILKNK